MQGRNHRLSEVEPTAGNSPARIGSMLSAWIALLSYANLAVFATFDGRYVVLSDAAAATPIATCCAAVVDA